ncbi:MAG TPA: peptide ABC transporter substrate-binding protein [Chthonomonadaceae bacterium]|nr:peptide ABC transporter substrate-binding protein [Chthonomonadaceae bacterium]
MALLILALGGCTTGRRGQTSASDLHTLREVLYVEPTTLDPSKVPDLPTSELLMHIFEGLVRTNPSNQVEPALAESWTISKDGKTYTFHLRNDAAFSNGRPLVAADFKYSWEHALSPQTASPVAANYLDGILGVKDVVAGRRKDLPGVQALDEHTLQVQIDRPRAYFLGMLSYPTGWAICKEAVEKNGGVVDQNALIGTGPYTLESYRPGNNVTLAANPHYWGGRPKMDRIEWPIIVDRDTIYNNFVTGRLDIVTLVPPIRYAQDRDAHKLADAYKLLPTASVDYLSMNEAVPVFANKLVRQAIVLAIDRAQIWRVAYKQVGTIAEGMLPPDLPAAGPLPPPTPYDPAKARQLLAQAGYPGGKGFPPITFSFQQHEPTVAATAQLIMANLRDNLGLTVNPQVLEFGELINEENKHVLQLYLSNWVADYPDPQDFLSTLFVSTAPLDRTGYKDPAFDALCARADAEPDPAIRAGLYSRANRILMDDAPVLPLVFTPRIILVQPNVQSWRANLCNLLPNTQTVKTGSRG